MLTHWKLVRNGPGWSKNPQPPNIWWQDGVFCSVDKGYLGSFFEILCRHKWEWESNSRKIDFHVIFAPCSVILLMGMEVEIVELLCLHLHKRWCWYLQFLQISNKERLAGFVNRAPHMRYFLSGLSLLQQKMLSTLWLNRNLTALQAHVNITGFATFQTTS